MTLSLALVAGTLAGCASAPRAIADDAQFEARAGDVVGVTGSATTIALVSIADSRCPADVQCISAGDVAVAVRLRGDEGVRTDTLRINMAPHAIMYGQQRLELLGVRPVPRSTDRERASIAVLRVTSAP